MTAVVRAARHEDIRAIMAVHERCWRISYAGIADAGETFSRPASERSQMWQQALTNTRVAVADGVVAGFALTGPSRDADAPPRTAEILALYVDPEAQGGGHGRALVEAALLELAEASYERVTLWTFADNPASRGFYERLGFVSDGAVRTDRGGTVVRYHRDL